ncbi:MAG: hypothetical protein AB8F74_04945 [Saprospiraceae bacterium]
MAKFASIMTLILCFALFNSCGSSNGCKGGGWYGDRNLTEIAPEKPDLHQRSESYEECD